jgi:hypothetical protein
MRGRFSRNRSSHELSLLMAHAVPIGNSLQ